MEDTLLSARGVHKTYLLGRRTLEVLRGVDVELRRGEFLALRGASGAGKSTLLHLLGGLDSPNQGEVWLGGKNLAALSRLELARVRNQEVGFIFQAYYLLPELDALENVCLPARMKRTAAAEAEARGRELLKLVGLADRIEHKPYELSGGEQQRVAIARALICNPSLILADEPTGNLDSRTGTEIMRIFRDANDAGITVVLVTHDADVAAQSRRIVRFLDGRLVTDEVAPHLTPEEAEKH